ncbi:rRNA-processing protein EFG1-like [Nymphaea colorata]|nr:rRNA-processing protein EFG1-like [Nymphaea colorata]
MAHGGYGRRRIAQRGRVSRQPRGLAAERKPKSASLKNQIRSVERILLRKNLPAEVRDAQEKRLEELKRQQDIQNQSVIERKLSMRYRRVKFFERRKIERRIRRLERLQRTADQVAQDQIAQQLFQLREDLEYVRFFPKSEKYVSLFMGGDDVDIVDRRNRLRKQIKANLLAAAASGKDLEETGSDEDGPLDVSEDDFFLSGSSSDEADADDEWTDINTREQASGASGRATSGMSSDEKNQRQIYVRALLPPPRIRSAHRGGFSCSSSTNTSTPKGELSSSSNTSQTSRRTSKLGGSSKSLNSRSSNLSSNSDSYKPKRKRQWKKRKQA